MTDTYLPPKHIIENYAKVLVRYAINSGKGVQKGEVVQIVVPDVAKPLALALRNEVLKVGGHPLLRLAPTEFEADFFALASDEQLTFFPKAYLQSRAELIDHAISIIADTKPDELSTTKPEKIMRVRSKNKEYRDWLTLKESQGKFTWTVALWATPAKAKMVGLTLEEYWREIIKACFLDAQDPIAEWKKVVAQQAKIISKLNSLDMQSLHVEGKDVDLRIKMGEKRRWLGGSGRNIPSFEIFTSPDWREASGWIRFNQPLYRYGSVITDIRLEFDDGRVTHASAKTGEDVLKEMVATQNADKIGEFSLTDGRHSRITHVMAETLYDENMGGAQGNTHIALGMAYQDTYAGDPALVSPKQWEEMGFNDSAIHTDMISTTRRTVTATLADGSQKVIYSDGKFTL